MLKTQDEECSDTELLLNSYKKCHIGWGMRTVAQGNWTNMNVCKFISSTMVDVGKI